jgi:hypothetical protein
LPGASAQNIDALLSKDFIKLVVLAIHSSAVIPSGITLLGLWFLS